jgi:hypothetical protein
VIAAIREDVFVHCWSIALDRLLDHPQAGKDCVTFTVVDVVIHADTSSRIRTGACVSIQQCAPQSSGFSLCTSVAGPSIATRCAFLRPL